MKLYYMPAGCSLSVQITLRELGVDYEPVLVRNGRLPDGTDYTTVNPRGQVPVLELADGSRLTEGPVIVQFLVDGQRGSTLLPPVGTMDRYRELEWLNYLTSEVHQRFYPLFKFPTLGDEATRMFRDDLDRRLAFVSERLDERPFLMGDTMTSADGYLFAMLRWTGHLKVDLARWPNLVAFMERMTARPAVRAAMVDAGLRKPA